jgi:CysZ protein
MVFIKDFYTGLVSYADAWQLIKKHQLWQFFIIPGILNLLLSIAVMYTAWVYSADITDWAILKLNAWDFSIRYPWMIRYVVRILLYIFLFTLYLKTYKYMVMILLAPALAYMAERTQELATGARQNFQMGVFIKNIIRGLAMSLRNMLVEIPLTILLFVLSFIPVIGLGATAALFYVESYFWGLAMVDYRNELQGMGVRQSIKTIRAHQGLAVANGAVFVLMLAIPVVGLMVAPALSVVAAGLGANKVISPVEEALSGPGLS